jgi:hypothetical protein
MKVNGNSLIIISAREDMIPFRVCIKKNERSQIAVLTDYETGKRILFEFDFRAEYPDAPQDIYLYPKITCSKRHKTNIRNKLFEWAYEQSNRFETLLNNWEALNAAWETIHVLQNDEWW